MRLWAAPLLALASPAAAQEVPELALPVTPACISSPFGARGGDTIGPHASDTHSGIDLPAPPGAWVHAAAAGQVVAIGRRGASGLAVQLRHAGGAVTVYAHLGTVAPALASGRRRVAQGERLGRVGRTGVTYGTHLHFEIRLLGVAIDPAPHLPAAPCAP